MQENHLDYVGVLKNGGVVVLPTDTLYGIVGRAENPDVVERIYKIRKRAPQKPCIILISDISELEFFSINVSKEQEVFLNENWPGQVSVILDCLDEKFEYLHRGTQALAFRLPKEKDLRSLISQTGPLIAPSANVEGFPPAKNITEAKKYFGNLVDVYVDGGSIEGKASRIVKLNQDGTSTVIRE